MIKDKKKLEKEVDKLLSEYRRRIESNKINLNVILINFVQDYNNIWKEFYDK